MATPDDAPLDCDPDVAAAELALGLLEGDERAAALRRQLAEPAFARAVEHWREHFAVLFSGSVDRAPPTYLADHIEAHLDRPAQAVATVMPRFWRPLAIASTLAASLLLGLIVGGPVLRPAAIDRPAGAQMVAALALSDHKGAPLAAYYDAAGQRVRMPAPMPIPDGRSAQLWAIVDGHAPIPLGLFHIVGNSVVADAKGKAPMASGTMLAISFEPVGGSPTGQPTGPVVASGMLSKV